MDAKKLTWWETLATKGGTKTDKKEPASNESAIAASEEGQDAAAVGAGQGPDAAALQPGAIAVRGPEYRGSSGFDDTSTVQGGRGGVDRGGRGGGGDNDYSNEAPPIHVDSYVVRDSLTDDEIRERILAGTARAEEVDKTELSVLPPRLHSRNAALGLLVFVVVVAAIAVGVAVPLSMQQSSVPSAQQQDENVVASFKYLEYQGDGGFAQAIFAETRKLGAADRGLVTSGAFEQIKCTPKACMESDTNCLVGEVYVPGCCAGPDCPNATKCGDICPPPPESCSLTDPTNLTCLRSECYSCHQVDGQETYVLRDFAFEIDCLEVGTAIRPENGLEYKWVIFCGPVIVGPIVEENRDLGEYQCAAMRLGANFTDNEGGGGLGVGFVPCQFIALVECGCGPSDMYTFGLPEPTGPCQPNDGCPILCEGVGGGNEYVKNLCRSFPGNISWWEGSFLENILAPTYEFEIYIKGVD